MCASMPAACNAASVILIGKPEKYAAGPRRTTGWSIGCAPALSGMRASSTLIATRSSERPLRPPASPTAMVTFGLAARNALRNARSEASNSVGSSTAMTRWPSIVPPPSARTACQDGLTASSANGEKPVRRRVGSDEDIITSPFAPGIEARTNCDAIALRYLRANGHSSAKHQQVHERQIHDQQRRAGFPLRADHVVLVRKLQQRHRHDVEVRGHRREQRAAIAGDHAQCAEYRGVGAVQVDQQR